MITALTEKREILSNRQSALSAAEMQMEARGGTIPQEFEDRLSEVWSQIDRYDAAVNALKTIIQEEIR